MVNFGACIPTNQSFVLRSFLFFLLPLVGSFDSSVLTWTDADKVAVFLLILLINVNWLRCFYSSSMVNFGACIPTNQSFVLRSFLFFLLPLVGSFDSSVLTWTMFNLEPPM